MCGIAGPRIGSVIMNGSSAVFKSGVCLAQRAETPRPLLTRVLTLSKFSRPWPTKGFASRGVRLQVNEQRARLYFPPFSKSRKFFSGYGTAGITESEIGRAHV